MKKQLRSCPFCGGRAYIRVQTHCYGHGEYGDQIAAVCEKCYAEGPLYENYQTKTSKKELRQMAADAWNKRDQDELTANIYAFSGLILGLTKRDDLTNEELGATIRHLQEKFNEAVGEELGWEENANGNQG